MSKITQRDVYIGLQVKHFREDLRISQAELSRLCAAVTRYKINQAECGSGRLTTEELRDIQTTLHAELTRLRSMAVPELLRIYAGGSITG